MAPKVGSGVVASFEGCAPIQGATALLSPATDACESPVESVWKPKVNSGARQAAQVFDQHAFLAKVQRTLGQASLSRGAWAMDDVSKPRGKVLTASEANAVAARISADPSFPSGYLIAGCESRAHLVCDRLRQEGIATAKVFVSSSALDDTGPSFRAAGPLMGGEWSEHVAALVYVRDAQSGAVDLRVIDPGFSNTPLKVTEWLARLETVPPSAST